MSRLLFMPFKCQLDLGRILPLISFCGILAGGACGAETAPPKVFSANPQVLVAAKMSLAKGESSLRPALGKLVAEANRMLSMKPPTVMDKKQVPPSGDKHDYLSWAPYFWRDTNSPGGKYIRRDGERNPEAGEDSDATRLAKVCAGTHTLALANYFVGDEKYAAKAAEIIRIFFLNPKTRMNPNLNFGQGIPGEVTGRPAGLISARGLVDLVDTIGLLDGSKFWSAADQRGMTNWAGQYLHWLTTSEIGRGELAAKNNHGSFCDTQVAALALFIGQTEVAKNIIWTARTKRIGRQIEPDGRQPLELGRTLSFDYSLFNLQALVELADLGRNVGVDLWHYQTVDGRSLQKGLEFMAQFVDANHSWPYPQIHSPKRDELGALLFRTAAMYPDSQLGAALKFFNANELNGSPVRLISKSPTLLRTDGAAAAGNNFFKPQESGTPGDMKGLKPGDSEGE
jgi:hypothetical protein